MGQELLSKDPAAGELLSSDPNAGASATDAPEMNFAVVNGQKVNLDDSPFLRGAYEFYKKSPIGAAVDLAHGVTDAVGVTGDKGFHPLDAAWDAGKNILKAQWDQGVLAAQKAKEAKDGGGVLSASEALGHGLAAILPLIGPPAADVGEHGARGDIAGMVGGGLGLLTPFAAKYGLDVQKSGSAVPTTSKVAAAAPQVSKADRLVREAEQTVSQRVLGPANPKYKPTATAIAPEVLSRGLSGDRIALQQTAEQGMSDAGSAIDTAVAAKGGLSVPVAIQPVVDALTDRIKDYQVNGETIPTATAKVAHLTKLRDYLQKRGAQLPLAEILKIRDEFYDTAAKAGGYARQGNAELGDLEWATREAGSAIRQHLAQLNPDAAAARADYTFWKSLNDVLDPDLGRPKSGAPSAGVTGGRATIGAVVANALDATPVGKVAVAIGLGKIFPMLQDLTNSPAWQLAKASDKMKLAEAIRKGQASVAQGVILKISAAAPRSAGGTAQVATDQPPAAPAIAAR